MNETPEENPASEPPISEGGAVDDMTPQSGEFSAHRTLKDEPSLKDEFNAARTAENDFNSPTMLSDSRPAPDLQIPMTEIPPKVPAGERSPKPPGRTTGHQGVLGAPGTLGSLQNDDIQIQDLSKEVLLRNTQRVIFRGQPCPSLNGIPLVSKLGQGGMGAVYCGVHPRLQNRVAVKVLPMQMASDDTDLVQRLIREAQIAAMIQSPHLAAVYDVNEEDGQFFIVMEYVPGLTMGQYLRQLQKQNQAGMPELDAIDVCIAASIGLDAAHQESVIHRDLKPENIMVPYKNRQRTVLDLKKAKLMDLGLARSEKGSQSLTGMKVAMGTPGYMSPEQIMNARTASKPSDVYGMGATLYAFLTGRPPYKEDDHDDMMRLLFATVNEPVPSVLNKRKDVSASLVKLLEICLAKKPEDRYPDAQELVRALLACRRVISPSSGFDDFGGAVAGRPAPTTDLGPAVYTQGLTVLPVNLNVQNGTRIGGRMGIGNRKWLAAGLGIAGAAVLAGSVLTVVYWPKKKDYADDARDLVIQTHALYYGEKFKAAIVDGDMDKAWHWSEAAKEHAQKNPGIQQIAELDATADKVYELAQTLKSVPLSLIAIKSAEDALKKIAADDPDKNNDRWATKAFEAKIKKAKIKALEVHADNDKVPPRTRLEDLTELAELDPGNKLIGTLKPKLERQLGGEKANKLLEKAQADMDDERYELALKEVQEAMKLNPDVASEGTKLEHEIISAIERITGRKLYSEVVDNLDAEYGKALGFIASSEFDKAENAAKAADGFFDKAKKIDPTSHAGDKLANLHQHIDENRKAKEYRDALADIRTRLKNGDADGAGARLDEIKGKKPSNESDFEAQDLVDRIAHARYKNALNLARAELAAEPNLSDSRLKRAQDATDLAAKLKPAKENGSEILDLRTRIANAIQEQANHIAYATAMAAAQNAKSYRDKLNAIDVAFDKAAPGKELTALQAFESQVVTAERERIDRENAAAKQREIDAKASAEKAQEFARKKENAIKQADLAKSQAEKFLGDKEYDKAILAFERAKKEINEFDPVAANALELRITEAGNSKKLTDAATIREQRITKAIAYSDPSLVQESEIDSVLRKLVNEDKDLLSDEKLAGQKNKLVARQEERTRKAALEAKDKRNKDAIEKAVVAFRNEKYADIVKSLAVLDRPDAPAIQMGMAELQEIVQKARAEVATIRKAYEADGIKEKVSSQFPEEDRKFNVALDTLLKIDSVANRNLVVYAISDFKFALNGTKNDAELATSDVTNSWNSVKKLHAKIVLEERAKAAKEARRKVMTDSVAAAFKAKKYEEAIAKLTDLTEFGEANAADAIEAIKELQVIVDKAQYEYKWRFDSYYKNDGFGMKENLRSDNAGEAQAKYEGALKSLEELSGLASTKLSASSIGGIRATVAEIKQQKEAIVGSLVAAFNVMKPIYSMRLAEKNNAIATQPTTQPTTQHTSPYVPNTNTGKEKDGEKH